MRLASIPRRLAGLLLAACALASIPAQAGDGGFTLSIGSFNRISGSGKLQSETRSVSGFQAIALRSSMKLVLRQGAREGVELRADDNLLPLIETEVVDRNGVPTLELRMKRGTSFSSRNPIVATIDLVTLRALSISGSGEVVSDALKTPALAIAISGSGHVKLKQLVADELSAKVSGSGDLEFSGRAGRLGVSIAGSGDVNARALEADDVSVSVAGSGDAHVTARKSLNISIAGNGSVTYGGDAAVKTSIAGHGSVQRQ
jgi:hypothetical protein